MSAPSMLIEPLLSEVIGIRAVNQMQVVDFIEQPRALVVSGPRPELSLQQIEVGRIFPAALKVTERCIELRRQAGLARGVSEELEP